MKKVIGLMGIFTLLMGAASCKSEQAQPVMDAAGDDNAGKNTDKASAPAVMVVGEGLDAEEAKALLREEKVMAGTSIANEDVKSELLRIEEEIRADIEGREPDFANAGVKPEMKPLVAKETFTADAASSHVEYERDMAIMKLMREYIAEKKADQAKAKAEGTPANAAKE